LLLLEVAFVVYDLQPGRNDLFDRIEIINLSLNPMIKVNVGIPQFLGSLLHRFQQIRLLGKYKLILLCVLAEIYGLVLLEKLRHLSVVDDLVLLNDEIFGHVIFYTIQYRHDTLNEKRKVIDSLM
jgi:hypothetical protein